MNTSHYPHWPSGLPYSLTLPDTSLYVNLDIAACRFPNRAATIFYDSVVTYRQLHAEVLALAGYLQQICGIQRGDRVLLDMQNCPQFVIAYYAILRVDAIVVPINPMLLTEEIRHHVTDSGAIMAITAQELLPQILPLLSDARQDSNSSGQLRHLIVASYADYLTETTDLNVPAQLQERCNIVARPGITLWKDSIAGQHRPLPHRATSEDIACLPYTSGTTGKPKACIHTHRSLMFTAVASVTWSAAVFADHVSLAVLPFFHVTGMQFSMNSLVYCGGTIVILPRWDRDIAGQLITRHGVTTWACVPTMMIDFISNPLLDQYDISNLRRILGGGAPMPKAIAQKLKDLTGQQYMEGYGLTETISATHANPPQRLRQQCLGIPVFNVDSRIIDPVTLKELPPHEVGEIIISGPQLFQGYWNDPQKTAEAFIELDGKRFFRSGDLGYMDEDGFFFFTDRLKRMINAAGFKVWPAEVEVVMYQHHEILECCIIAARDSYRGETVKAVVVRKPGSTVTQQAIIDWARDHMAAYKTPRLIEFVDSLPKSLAGKVLWKVLQDKEFV